MQIYSIRRIHGIQFSGGKTSDMKCSLVPREIEYVWAAEKGMYVYIGPVFVIRTTKLANNSITHTIR